MRGRAFALEAENQMLSSLNQIESKDQAKILAKIVESVFTMQDVDKAGVLPNSPCGNKTDMTFFID